MFRSRHLLLSSIVLIGCWLTLSAQPEVFGHALIGGRPFDVYGAELQGTVRIGGIVLTNPRLDFLDLPIGNLGSRFLKNLVVTFDPKNRRVRFRD